MAKVTGPLMSLDASGSIASTITFSKWKGRNYVRQLTIPSNPSTGAQVAIRLALGAIAKAARSVLTSFTDSVHVGSPFFQAARDQAPSGQSWISFVQKMLANIFLGTILTAYMAETGTVRGYFVSAAAGIGLVDYSPEFAADFELATVVNGLQLYALAYFAANFLTGDIQTAANTALVGASSGDVSDFAAMVHATV